MRRAPVAGAAASSMIPPKGELQMKLYYSATSPYVRKVTVTAHETGLHSRIQRIDTDIRAPAKAFIADNPLGKVPTLVTDDGLQLFDSRMICEFLDSLHEGHRLFPTEVPQRWRTLRLAALAEGVIDAAVLRRMEMVRPDKEQSASWIERQRAPFTQPFFTFDASHSMCRFRMPSSVG